MTPQDRIRLGKALRLCRMVPQTLEGLPKDDDDEFTYDLVSSAYRNASYAVWCLEKLLAEVADD